MKARLSLLGGVFLLSTSLLEGGSLFLSPWTTPDKQIFCRIATDAWHAPFPSNAPCIQNTDVAHIAASAQISPLERWQCALGVDFMDTFDLTLQYSGFHIQGGYTLCNDRVGDAASVMVGCGFQRGPRHIPSYPQLEGFSVYETDFFISFGKEIIERGFYFTGAWQAALALRLGDFGSPGFYGFFSYTKVLNKIVSCGGSLEVDWGMGARTSVCPFLRGYAQYRYRGLDGSFFMQFEGFYKSTLKIQYFQRFFASILPKRKAVIFSCDFPVSF